jgi:two-component system nitrogen regulation response regulator GlnG
MPTLLVVDDEPSILLAFRRAFHSTAVTVVTGETGAEALTLAGQHHPDVVVLDVQLPDQTGLEVLRKLRELDARSLVVFITGKSTTETAIEATKLGAFDYLLKPLELAQLRQVIDRALAISRKIHVPAVVADGDSGDDRADVIVGQCPAMQEVYKAIGRVAGQDVTVLISGETGTGKELVARALYQHSRRAAGPFLAINCAALPEHLLESELFGHEKGAFTGADRRRIGKFEQCSGGTLFLDEISDLPAAAQGKMLRLLQEREFERLGGNEIIKTDIRLLAATNRNLEALVKKGRFREDLYYRLSVFTIRLPPLRERGEDLPLLVQHYVRRFCRKFDKDLVSVPPETLTLLGRCSWPGNVRELQNALELALVQTVGGVLAPDFLPADFRKNLEATAGTEVEHGEDGSLYLPSLPQFIDEQLRLGTENLYEDTLRRMERLLVTRVLHHTNGNQVQAAKILGITRGSLRTKIRDLGITIARTVAGGDDSSE